jgi:hypothetical protein
MEIGEHRTVAGKAVEVWRRETLRAENADVAVALVVGENHDDIREALGAAGDEGEAREQGGEGEAG